MERVALYLQDAHPIREGIELVRYAESKGFDAVWQADSRLVRDAVVPMAAMKELRIDPARLNVHGGAVALGHPLGATGARMVTTLLYALKRMGLKRGIASPCIGGEEAVALAVELLN